MINIKKIETFNFEGAIRGMRNPLNSHDKSDSFKCPKDCKKDDFKRLGFDCSACTSMEIGIGEKDLELALKLVKAGSDHRKFMRQIFVSMDILAPLYWWKEMDQYRISCTTNSTSTMHTLHKTPITIDMFSTDKIKTNQGKSDFNAYIEGLEMLRQFYIKKNDKDLWEELIQMLPSSFNQLRTWTSDYEVLRNIYHSRKPHPLNEWREFCGIIETLPYSELITIK